MPICWSVHVWRCACVQFQIWKNARTPWWHRPPQSFMFHLRHDYTPEHVHKMHKHTLQRGWLLLWLHVMGSSLRRPRGLRDTITYPESLQATLGQAAHRQSLQSQVSGSRSPEEDEERLEERQQIQGFLWTRKKHTYLVQWSLGRVGVWHTNMHTRTRSWESYSDRQFCQQWLPSCHSDMERLGPYERLGSPKRCLGAGVRKMCQSLRITGHNQMWKLPRTLQRQHCCQKKKKKNALCTLILMPFFSRLHEQQSWWWWGLGNTLATPDSFKFLVQGFWTHPTHTEKLRMLIIQQDYHPSGWVMEEWGKETNSCCWTLKHLRKTKLVKNVIKIIKKADFFRKLRSC